ncbi:PP2C family protein-serine/threonine phosphatase [Nocardioides panaciterrulae]|uniref:protein-serine/threonine phosphatase n=1 Tax=Nocardioides panaciterrulae TaxID=661492 RepID=A0A7Y9JE12_9ACTN|nr:PP2C family protein-serine/threonine phosphatase [Nocardioides panaciterrulae]NYD43809.1 serine phosphatase RsbU (regulator of sigma subunit) [Nocardioides panaciterrulae]
MTDDRDVVDPRRPAPGRRLDLLVAAATTLLAATVYLVTLLLGATPPRPASVILSTATPAFALVALVALELRQREAPDPWLAWFAAGLTGGIVAMGLQLISYPLVDPGGGPFGTDDQGNAALYLLFHLSVGAGVLLAALRAPARRRWLLSGSAAVLAVLLALGAVPLPELLSPDRTYTTTLLVAEWVLAAWVAVATVAWILPTGGRSTPALRGWIGVALLLSVYDLVLNALASERFVPVWWGSLSLRVLTYAVLALGVVTTLVLQLRDLDRYSETELDRREGQLRQALQSASALMASAELFSRATTPDEVAATLCEQTAMLSGLPRSELVVWHDLREPTALAQVGATPPAEERDRWPREAGLTMSRLYATGEGVFLETADEVAGWLAGRHGPASTLGALVLVPLVSPQAPPALLVAWGEHPHALPLARRRVIANLVNQAGQAWGRASAYQAQAHAAATLQASLLPTGLTPPPGLSLAARYVPGESGLRVGGDWFDCLRLPDGRVALVVGDVMGKGLHAAAVMGQVRTTARTLARLDPAPEKVLTGLDELTHELDIDEIATVTYALLDLSSGGLSIGRAGHVPPLLVPRRGRTRYVVPGGSPPLGAPSAARVQADLQLRPGDVLVLYTDGLVEDRVSGLDFGMHELSRTAESLRDRFQLDLEGCTDRLLAWSGTDHRDDDVALMVVRLDGPLAAPPEPPRGDVGAQPLPA